MSGFQGEERSDLKATFSTMNRKVKARKQIWGTMINIFGDQGNSAKIFGIKGTRTSGFINGEQGIKSKKSKGSREHEPLLGGAL